MKYVDLSLPLENDDAWGRNAPLAAEAETA